MTWNYIAGFFDGEGSIGHSGKGFRITIPQTNHLVLEEIRNFLKIGSIISTTKRKSHWKDSWVYYIAKQKDVQIFLQNTLPHLIVKQSAARKAIEKIGPIVLAQVKRAGLAEYRRKQVKTLRKAGLSYREIGRRVGIDWGYARRLVLNK